MTVAVAVPQQSSDLRERFAALAAPTPIEKVQWRQDAAPIEDRKNPGQWVARYVAFVDAPFVQERLDSVDPTWDLTHAPLPMRPGDKEICLKASLTILGHTRDGVGSGSDLKAAATDSLKRAAVRFGVALDLYSLDMLWVPMDGGGRDARPKEPPSDLYRRRHSKTSGRDGQSVPPLRAGAGEPTPGPNLPPPPKTQSDFSYAPVACPKCGARMWDNRLTKKGRQPDYKCTKKTCDGAKWLDAPNSNRQTTPDPYELPARQTAPDTSEYSEYPEPLLDDQDDLPF